MAVCSDSFVCSVILCVIFCVIFTDNVTADFTDYQILSSPEFSRHKLIKPKIYHGREKRQISTTKEKGGIHTHDLTIGYNVDGKDFILDLRLNRELIPRGYFERYQHSGKHVVNRPTGKDVELCQYQGALRGVNGSWAALSTCHKGLSGVIFDGNDLHYLEKVNNSELDTGFNDVHFFYKHADLVENKTCGYSSSTPDNHQIFENNEYNRILRYKRATDDNSNIRGPYNSNKQSRYVELVLVVDQQEFKSQGENLTKVNNRCKDIANIINALYAPLNIFIALVGVVVWTEVDEIKLSENGDTTLNNFLHYRRERLVKEHPNDNAQLLTRVQFEGGVVGKALKGPICTFEFSGGVSMDHSNTVGLVATTVAHEMGHNFGMEHDTSECKCPEDRCIMAPSSSSLSPKHWSSCSLEYLALAFDHGMDYCLRNKPERLFDSPVCGNGFVEPGEQCDCGMEDRCSNTCCNATTCMLFSNASCATGECCDLTTCRPKTAGTECRSADHECDLPEYCTGQSEYCPADVYKMDTETCDNGKAFCYQGSCRTRSDQCKLLWGPSGRSSDDQCYEMNKKGSRHGNCGYNRLNQSFIKCNEENIFCGMLHCRHLNERLEFGMESVAILSHSFINSKGSIIPCRTAIVDLGLNQIDPGLAPDGAKCGDGKMCVNQKCMPVENLRLALIKEFSCPDNCNSNGVCNSKGNCHCSKGFEPPNCDYPGVGGSIDSGPASDPNAHRDFVMVMYIIFLGIVPTIAIICLLYYYQRHNLILKWPKGSTKTSKTTSKNLRGNPAFQNAPQTIEISSRTDDNSSLLPRSESQTPGTPSSGINNNFFGHFKGFSLTPLQKPELPNVHSNSTVSTVTNSPFIKNDTKNLPQRSAPPIPTVPNIVIKSPVMRTSTAQGNKPNLSVKPIVSRLQNTRPNSLANGVSTTNNVSTAPALPPLNPGASGRPLISSPILENSTCTAKELISPLKNVHPKIPIRPAPEAPSSNNVPLSPVSKRPLSSPNTVMNAIPTVTFEEANKGKHSGSALNRIASFLKPQKEDKKQIPSGTNSLPRNVHHSVKANKLMDKNQLKNLEISNPIPQTEIEIANNALPLADIKDTKSVVMRAQSMRGTTATPRPTIPTFGSMRQPNHAKRPTSIPVANRPTSPPPPRPPSVEASKTQSELGIKLGVLNKISSLTGYPNKNDKIEYPYDDCMTESTAPLANISEETSPDSTDNIYAIIEECPPVKLNGAGVKDTSPPSDYQSPKPLENKSDSGSSESMGLLGEIVSEIQNINFDSIYSTSTLARKKKEAASKENNIKSDNETDDVGKNLPDKNSMLVSSDSSLGMYANTTPIYKTPENVYSNMNPSKSSASSTTSSGYLNPSALNPPIVKPVQKNIEEPKNPTPMSTFKGTESNTSTKLVTDLNNYKPFASTLHRNAGPFASTFKNTNFAKSEPEKSVEKDKTPIAKTQTPPSPTTKTVKSITRQATPPNLKKQATPPNLKRQATPPNLSKQPTPALSRQATPPNLKATSKLQPSRIAPIHAKNVPKTGQKTQSNSNNTPDVVTSCESSVSSTVSPDVVNNSSTTSTANHNSAISSTATKSKPVISTPKVVKQPAVSPKPSAVAAKGSESIGKSNSDTKSNSGSKSIGSSTTGKSASDAGSKSMPVNVRRAANQTSNVASLQKKFETNNKSNINSRTSTVGQTKRPTTQIK